MARPPEVALPVLEQAALLPFERSRLIGQRILTDRLVQVPSEHQFHDPRAQAGFGVPSCVADGLIGRRVRQEDPLTGGVRCQCRDPLEWHHRVGEGARPLDLGHFLEDLVSSVEGGVERRSDGVGCDSVIIEHLPSP